MDKTYVADLTPGQAREIYNLLPKIKDKATKTQKDKIDSLYIRFEVLKGEKKSIDGKFKDVLDFINNKLTKEAIL